MFGKLRNCDRESVLRSIKVSEQYSESNLANGMILSHHFVVTLIFLFSLLSLLNTKCGFQVQYQTIVCIWLLSFTPELSTRMVRYNPVPILADILGEAAKEKVTRIVLATFRVCVMISISTLILKSVVAVALAAIFANHAAIVF